MNYPNTMESWHKAYYQSHSGWDFSNGKRDHGSMYNQGRQNSYYQHQQSFQNRYPEEWRNPKLQEMKIDRMRRRKDISAVNPLVKHFLFSVNLLFLVVGVTITALSVYIITEEDETIDCVLDFIFSPACLLCSLGSLIVVPAFLGCYGALRENTCVIKLYLLVAIILLLLEIVLVIGFFTFTLVPDALSNVGIYPQGFLEESILTYGDRLHKDDGCGKNSDDYLDFIHDKFSCCGSSDDDEGYLDWMENIYFQCTNNNTSPLACSVPISCCKADTTTYDCGANVLRPTNTDFSAIYIQGCEKGMRKVFEDNIFIIGCSSIAGIFVQVFFTWCAMRLNSQVNEQRSKW